MKGQASGKTTSAVDLLETLPVLFGIIIGGYGLSHHSGQVWFILVQLWSTLSLRMTVDAFQVLHFLPAPAVVNRSSP